MTKSGRTYPYNTGLFMGAELDIVLTDINHEPIPASSIFKDSKKHTIDKSGGSEAPNGGNQNYFKLWNEMVRLTTQRSYCRAFSLDNIWLTLKGLIGFLDKRAYINAHLIAPNSKIAGGRIVLAIKDSGLYTQTQNTALKTMTYEVKHESHERLKNNIRLTIGLLSVLLDQSQAAQQRRKFFTTNTEREFPSRNGALIYQPMTNFWIYSPILAHLMFGAVRMAYFITLNKIEDEIYEGFESQDVIQINKNSDLKGAIELWEMLKARYAECGYRTTDNPFSKQPAVILDALIKYGIKTIGPTIYKNWRMLIKKTNYNGHCESLPSWEHGAKNKIFNNKHPLFDDIQKLKKGQKKNA